MMAAGSLPRGAPLHRPHVLLATWFGTGLLPKAPGTWGSLAALPFAWAIQDVWGAVGLVVAAALLFLAGWWASALYVRGTQMGDPGEIVIDEVAAQWLVLAAGPLSLPYYALAFALFRAADILKPFPANWADRRLHGGLGVMADDILAAPYAMVVLWAASVALR
jgi:phosphatidylglycerophosphatase A